MILYGWVLKKFLSNFSLLKEVLVWCKIVEMSFNDVLPLMVIISVTRGNANSTHTFTSQLSNLIIH